MSIRDVDVAARLGGDEFAVILPETHGKNGLIVAQRLHGQLTSVLEVPAGEVRIHCSIGFVSYPDNVSEKNKEALYKAMDDMLYQAKRLGKGQVAAPGLAEAPPAPPHVDRRHSPPGPGRQE